MSTLQERLERVKERHGADSPAAQMLQDKITAEASGKSAHELYVTGSVKRTKEPAPAKGEDK
jgi:hypothetical protein